MVMVVRPLQGEVYRNQTSDPICGSGWKPQRNSMGPSVVAPQVKNWVSPAPLGIALEQLSVGGVPVLSSAWRTKVPDAPLKPETRMKYAPPCVTGRKIAEAFG